MSYTADKRGTFNGSAATSYTPGNHTLSADSQDHLSEPEQAYSYGYTPSITPTHSYSTARSEPGTLQSNRSLSARKGKLMPLKVQMLDDSIVAFQLPSHALGVDLLEACCQSLNLLESDYFGLQFYSRDDIPVWLDSEKMIIKQLAAPKKTNFLFTVKFYIPDPGQLQDEFTKYLYALQIKKDLANGKLPCSENTAALMASYVLQAEVGDYNPTEHDDGRYITIKFVPNQTRQLEAKIQEYHKNHLGQTPADADFNLLDVARRLEMYGVHTFPAKDYEDIQLYLAVTSHGVSVFQNNMKINTFSWAKIRKLSFKRKRFLVKLHPEGYGYPRSTVEFLLGSRNDCKRFWKNCVEHHTFFRHIQAKRTRPRRRLMSRGSSFRYSGRTQKQVTDQIRDGYVRRTGVANTLNTSRVSTRSLGAPRTTTPLTIDMTDSSSTDHRIGSGDSRYEAYNSHTIEHHYDYQPPEKNEEEMTSGTEAAWNTDVSSAPTTPQHNNSRIVIQRGQSDSSNLYEYQVNDDDGTNGILSGDEGRSSVHSFNPASPSRKEPIHVDYAQSGSEDIRPVDNTDGLSMNSTDTSNFSIPSGTLNIDFDLEMKRFERNGVRKGSSSHGTTSDSSVAESKGCSKLEEAILDGVLDNVESQTTASDGEIASGTEEGIYNVSEFSVVGETSATSSSSVSLEDLRRIASVGIDSRIVSSMEEIPKTTSKLSSSERDFSQTSAYGIKPNRDISDYCAPGQTSLSQFRQERQLFFFSEENLDDQEPIGKCLGQANSEFFRLEEKMDKTSADLSQLEESLKETGKILLKEKQLEKEQDKFESGSENSSSDKSETGSDLNIGSQTIDVTKTEPIIIGNGKAFDSELTMAVPPEIDNPTKIENTTEIESPPVVTTSIQKLQIEFDVSGDDESTSLEVKSWTRKGFDINAATNTNSLIENDCIEVKQEVLTDSKLNRVSVEQKKTSEMHVFQFEPISPTYHSSKMFIQPKVLEIASPTSNQPRYTSYQTIQVVSPSDEKGSLEENLGRKDLKVGSSEGVAKCDVSKKCENVEDNYLSEFEAEMKKIEGSLVKTNEPQRQTKPSGDIQFDVIVNKHSGGLQELYIQENDNDNSKLGNVSQKRTSATSSASSDSSTGYFYQYELDVMKATKSRDKLVSSSSDSSSSSSSSSNSGSSEDLAVNGDEGTPHRTEVNGLFNRHALDNGGIIDLESEPSPVFSDLAGNVIKNEVHSSDDFD